MVPVDYANIAREFLLGRDCDLSELRMNERERSRQATATDLGAVENYLIGKIAECIRRVPHEIHMLNLAQRVLRWVARAESAPG